MNGIIVVNKPSNLTSRDVVNKICKILNTKKVGHTGTLDPIAEGVLVICVGKATKLVEILTANDKEYIAEVKLGILTDTLDTEGKIIEEKETILDKMSLTKVLDSFVGTYEQKVPIYSAVKIDGKKLYEYARCGISIDLPSRKVTIKKIELLEFNKSSYKFKVLVSKGTYIRSLIKDINEKLGIIGVMSGLIRTKQGKFDINDSFTLKDIFNNNYNFLSITDVLKDENSIIIDDNLYNFIKNGRKLKNIYNKDEVVFVYNNEVIAMYKTCDEDKNMLKPYKMFI